MRIAHRQLTTALALSLICAAPRAADAACAEMSQAGASYTVCDYDARKTSIRLFLRDARGETYGAFSRLADDLSSKGQSLIFAMNAGMYGEDFSPVGLYVEAGKMSHAANTANGAGNFHLKPNGVFWIDGARAGVTETGRFLRSGVRAAYATQSGPMLLVGGRINPHIQWNVGEVPQWRRGLRRACRALRHL